MKGNGEDNGNGNKLVRNECKEMHGGWIRTLAVKNGYGNVMLYGFTIGGIQNLLPKREVQGSGCGVGFVFRIFMNFSLWKTNCRHNVISLWSLDYPITCKKSLAERNHKCVQEEMAISFMILTQKFRTK